jgi:hypothetical protein
MFFKKINDTILKCYVKSNTSRKYGLLAFTSYVVGVSVLFEMMNYANPAGDLLDVITNMFNDLAGAILRLSTAAALIGVGTGAFFKKLSFGKPDRIETGNKLIVNSIWGWILINGLTTILRWAGGYLGSEPVITWTNSPTSDIGGFGNQAPTNLPTDLIIGQ